jgi:RimJ/RimL family protein N-acetyltransferase/8-oxo-dGTP pyrophosphatase MutT (NUDIX family)
VSASALPVLSDGDIVLRPQAFEGVDAVRLPGEQGIGRYPDGVARFLIEHRAQVAGTAEIRLQGDGNAELFWEMVPGQQPQVGGTRAVRLLIRYAFEELGLHRVAAYVEPDDRASLQISGGAGLRREGVVRAARTARSAISGDPGGRERHDAERHDAERHDAERQDCIQLARLATDPEPTSGGGFIPVLNAGLPTKRVIAQGLIRNDANEILLCELTYKKEWDLPGGVVDPHESPAHAVVREIQEELQVKVSPQSLRAVNWLPPWRGWDDAMLFVFDLGVDDDVMARARLEPREILALHWCDLDRVERHAAPYVTRMLRLLAQESEGTAYLEDGADPGW